MRILHLSWEYPPQVFGGLGRHVHGLATAQADAGHDVTVLTVGERGAPVHDDVDGVHLLRVPADPPALPQDDLLASVLAMGHAWTRAGLREADHVKPDVLHAHDWMTCHAATALKEALRLPARRDAARDRGRPAPGLAADAGRAAPCTRPSGG